MVENRDLDAVKLLLESGASPNFNSNFTRTPSQLTSHNDDNSIVEELNKYSRESNRFASDAVLLVDKIGEYRLVSVLFVGQSCSTLSSSLHSTKAWSIR